MRVRHLAWAMLLSLPELTLPPGQLRVPPSPTIQLVTDWWGTLSSFSALSLKSCPTLCDPMDCSPPCSSDHGIFQAGMLEWVSTSYTGDLLDQGSNLRLLRLLHWQVYSLPLYHLGSPSLFLWFPIKSLEKTLAVLHLHSPQRAFSPSLSPDWLAPRHRSELFPLN